MINGLIRNVVFFAALVMATITISPSTSYSLEVAQKLQKQFFFQPKGQEWLVIRGDFPAVVYLCNTGSEGQVKVTFKTLRSAKQSIYSYVSLNTCSTFTGILDMVLEGVDAPIGGIYQIHLMRLKDHMVSW